MGAEAGQYLAGFVMDARLAYDRAPSLEVAASATAVIRTFLSHVPDERIPLSSTGYLPPASVSAMMADLDPDHFWIGATNREANVVPLLDLRETVTTLGLVRKYRGRLALTAKGTAARNDPIVLWNHLGTRLPVERTPHGAGIGLLLLLLVASEESEIANQLDLMTLTVGWTFEEPARYGRSAAMQAISATRHVLEWAGSSAYLAWPHPGGALRTGCRAPRASGGCRSSGSAVSLRGRRASAAPRQWYPPRMSGTQNVVVGNKGRIVIPFEVRSRRKWTEGTVLIAVETERGVILTERSELEEMVRGQLSGKDLVGSLIADRRTAATAEGGA